MQIENSQIPGVALLTLDIFADERGCFKEAWKTGVLKEHGLPDIVPVQYNVSESRRGVIRGIHAEPWDKYIHVPYGEVFAAIVDLREDQPSFGRVDTFTLDRTKALFLPKGVGNSFQALSELAVYTYLVTGLWQKDNPYPALACDDPDLAIPWPIQGDAVIVSEKDRHNRRFKEVYLNYSLK